MILALVLAGCAVLARLDRSARLCALLVLVPLVASGLAWLAGLRIITGRNLIGVTPFAAVALAAVLLALPRRAALAGAAAGLALAVLAYVESPVDERVPYDEVADALVATGWQPGDPMVVLGSLTDFRSPLEWYLPGDVTLATAVPREPCDEVWVVTDVPEGRGLLALARPTDRAEAGTVEVARVPWDGRWEDVAESRGGRYLDSARGAGCLLPTENRVT